MSFKARRVADNGSVVSFSWDGHGRRPAPEPVHAPAVEEAADGAEPPQQLQIAALEHDAYARGYEAGERAGLETGSQLAEGVAARLAQAIDELATARGQMIRHTERQMVELALGIARRIVHREVSLDRDLLIAMARVALDRLGESSKITIHLHPEEFQEIGAPRVSRLMGTSVNVLSDARLERGACLVESDLGTLDVSVDAQIEEVARALLGARRTTDDDRNESEPMSHAA